MKIRKIFNFLALTAVGFTFSHALLTLLYFHDIILINQISLHYSDGLTWYILYIFIPTVFGLFTAFFFKNRNISKGLNIMFYSILTLQVVFQITALSISSKYWGFSFKRPTIFTEISQADKIITFSAVTTYLTLGNRSLSVFQDTSSLENELFGRKDPYYGGKDRILMVFEDISNIHGDLYDFPKIYADSSKKIETGKLNKITNLIYSSGELDKGEIAMNDAKVLKGIIVEFQTQSNEKYIFAGLGGPEISNDHYPFYEFLFTESENGLKLHKQQRYYFDIAGLEGMEYTSISPLFSLILTLIATLATIPILITSFFKRRKERKAIMTNSKKQNNSC